MSTLRFGKHPPKRDYRTLRLKDYFAAGLQAPPAAFDVLPAVYGKLKISDPAILFPMDGNDALGDCTIAALAHASTVYHALVGKETVMSQKSVIKLYWHLTGGVDSGLNELDVLNYWRKHSAASERLLAFASIDVKSHAHVQQAIKIFGGVYLGFQVQQSCLADFNARKPWTPGPLTQDGHAVYAVAYDQEGVTVLTWGNTQKASWAWWDECVDEAYALLSAEATKFEGIKLAELKSDLDSIATAVA
jgi:hypothetical protein